jgi:hypothetical protein
MMKKNAGSCRRFFVVDVLALRAPVCCSRVDFSTAIHQSDRRGAISSSPNISPATSEIKIVTSNTVESKPNDALRSSK